MPRPRRPSGRPSRRVPAIPPPTRGSDSHSWRPAGTGTRQGRSERRGASIRPDRECKSLSAPPWQKPAAPPRPPLRTAGRPGSSPKGPTYTPRGAGRARCRQGQEGACGVYQSGRARPRAGRRPRGDWRRAVALGAHKRALAAFTGAARLDPRRSDAHYGRARSLQHIGLAKRSLAAIDRAAAKGMDGADMRLVCGDILCGLGRHGDAAA